MYLLARAWGPLPSRDSLHVALRVNAPGTAGTPLSVTIPFKSLSRDLFSSRATTMAEYSTVEASIPLAGMQEGIALQVSIGIGGGTTDAAVDPREWGSGMTGTVEPVHGTPAPGGHSAAQGSMSVIKGVNSVIVGRGTPVMDGSMDGAWTSAAVIHAQKLKQGSRQDTGLGAKNSFRLLWDEDNLYVLAQVQDPTPDVTASTSWEKDSIEFFLDEMNRHASYSAADGTHIRVDIRNNRSGELPEPAGVVSMVRIAAGTNPGYTVEFRIPFKMIAPVPGNVVGFDVQVNDAAGGGRQSIFGWNDDLDRASGVASALGQLVFAESAQPQKP